MAKLTTDEVKKIAALAKIQLTDEELEKFSEELTEILDFVEQLQEVEVEESEISHLDDFQGEVLRDDEPQTGLVKEDLPSEDRLTGNYYQTSQVVTK